MRLLSSAACLQTHTSCLRVRECYCAMRLPLSALGKACLATHKQQIMHEATAAVASMLDVTAAVMSHVMLLL